MRAVFSWENDPRGQMCHFLNRSVVLLLLVSNNAVTKFAKVAVFSFGSVSVHRGLPTWRRDDHFHEWWDLSNVVDFWAKIGALCSFLVCVCVRCKITVGHRVKVTDFSGWILQIMAMLATIVTMPSKHGTRKQFFTVFYFCNDTIRIFFAQQQKNEFWTEKFELVDDLRHRNIFP